MRLPPFRTRARGMPEARVGSCAAARRDPLDSAAPALGSARPRVKPMRRHGSAATRCACAAAGVAAVLSTPLPLAAQTPPVLPQGGGMVVVADSLGEAVFHLSNPAPYDTAFGLGCSTSGVIPGCAVDPFVPINPGGTRAVRVRFATREPGSGFLHLHLRTAAGGSGGHGWYQIQVVRRLRPPTVAPLNPTLAVRAGATASSAFFTIANPNGAAERYVLTCGGRGAVSECQVVGSVDVPGDSSVIVRVDFGAAESGLGTVRLSAAGAGRQGVGQYAVTGVAPHWSCLAMR